MREFVKSLLASAEFGDQIVHHHEVPAAAPRFRALRQSLPPEIQAAVGRLGVTELYSHQAEAVERIREGRNVAVVTPTASGKSLVHYLPTAERISAEGGHALYLFPHKALAQDQLEKLKVFGRSLRGLRDLTADIYDGDTPAAKRKKIRANPPDVLITNPDMLHLGLLAYHGEWAGYFAALRLIVVDELHVYRGVFGNHFAHVMRRLDRVTRHYRADPLYMVGSATVGNAASFAATLLGRAFDVVSESGSPRAGRHFLFVNPIGSPYTTAMRLFVAAVRGGFRTIAFTKARKITELIHSWVEESNPDLARRIAPYRAGYLPEERREIERRLFRGELSGVVATSALELGIDVGGLDVCILVGYPGSVMSAWQRIGRVGRHGRESLVILVAQPDALDQYFMAHPGEFFERGFEPAIVDPSNAAIARAHIVCAGAELPLDRREAEQYLPRAELDGLLAAGRLAQDADGARYFALRKRPHREVNLRSGGESYAIVHGGSERPIGTIDGVRVFHECHEGAIYLHGGSSYRIVRLDQEAKRVVAVPFRGEYYTQALGEKETEILETFREQERSGYRLSLGRLKVTVRIMEYARKRRRDQETISRHPLEVPPIVFETVGFWTVLPDSLERDCGSRGLHFMGGLHAAEHAMISLFPLLALCDRGDIGGISYARNPQLAAPAIFIYDGYPGGIGLAAAVHDRIEDLFEATRDLLGRCSCEDGCPSCVQSPRCGSGNRPLDKAAARRVLEQLAGGGAERREVVPVAASGGERPPQRARVRAEPEAPRAARAVPAAALPEASDDRGEALADGSREARAAGTEGGDATGRPRWQGGARGFLEPLALASHGSEAPAGAGAPSGRTGHPRSAASHAGPVRTAGGLGPFPLRPGEGRVVVFDVETQRGAEEVGGWDNIRDMGLALAVVYDVNKDEMTTYYEPDVERLVLDLVMADRVIGYNSDRFDLTVLSGYRDWNLSRIRSFDMLAYIKRRLGFRLKLGDLAECNLQVSKSADGLQSLEWYKQGRLDLIAEYCRRDVELTTRLFFLARERGYLLFRNREGVNLRLPVDW